MSQTLTVEILTRSAVTMLLQVLAEDSTAAVTSLDTAPLPSDPFGNRRERLRLSWTGEKGPGARTFILYGLPDKTWSEQVNPGLPAPAPVLFVESDLPQALTMLTEGFVAGGRRRGERPAWLLREDWTGTPALSEIREDIRKEKEARGEESEGVPSFIFSLMLSFVLEKTARFHALHWGAERVLNDVYPWLPRFGDWIKSEEAGAKSEETAEIMEALAGMPQTIIHGTWRAENLRLRKADLLVEGWDRVMVGPAAWDVACLLASLPKAYEETVTTDYLKRLGEQVHEFTDTGAFVVAVSRLRAFMEAR